MEIAEPRSHHPDGPEADNALTFNPGHSVGADHEVGEVMKATTLPINSPEPPLDFSGKRYCFTGTFVFGTRRDCEGAVTSLGASAGTLTKATDVLVVGEYATDSWAQSSYGRKIEKACVLRDKTGLPLIVTEQHWRGVLKVGKPPA